MLRSRLRLKQKPEREGERTPQAEGRREREKQDGVSGTTQGAGQGVLRGRGRLETGRAARIRICSQQNLVSALLIIYPRCNFSYQ